ARPAHRGAVEAGARTVSAVEDLDAAEALLRERLRPGDVVLVKASRAIGLDRLARSLIQPPGGARGQVHETPGRAVIPLPGDPAGQDDAGAGGLAAAAQPGEVGP
ncbi:MAG: hypothetical protein WAL50_14930, partial [Kineosporiaceae bacterium]